MTRKNKDKRKSIRLPSAGEGFLNTGRSHVLKEIRDAFLENGSRAVSLYGEPGTGKTSLAVKFVESLPEEFEYAYSFYCRGGISAEEVIFRLCQFLDFHDIGSFQNIILSPIPMELKVELIVKILNRLKILLVFDEIDSLLVPEHGRLVIGDTTLGNVLLQLIRECQEGARFLFTSTSRFETGLEYTSHIEVLRHDKNDKATHYESTITKWLLGRGASLTGTETAVQLMDAAISSLSTKAGEALSKASAFEKAFPASGVIDDESEIAPIAEELSLSGLAGTFTAGGETVLTVHTLAREHIRSITPKEQWKSLIQSAAEFREKYAKENGIIWHMIYAHELYVEAMNFEKAAEIAVFVTPTLLGWGQTSLAYELNRITSESSEGLPKAKALYTLGCIDMGNSEYDKALDHLNASMKLFDSLGDRGGYSDVLIQTGAISNNRKKHEDAIVFLEKALLIKEELEDVEGVSSILNRLGQIYNSIGETEKALVTYRRSAELASGAENERTELLALENLGGLHATRGEVDDAITAYERELEILQKDREPNALTRALNRLGGLYFRKGDGVKALDFLQRSLKYSEVTRNKELSAINLLEMSRVYFEASDYRAALRSAVLSLALFDSASSESKSAALEILSLIENEMGKEAFNKTNEDVLKELRQKEK